MTDRQEIRVDIRDAGFGHFTWVLQATNPVEDLFTTMQTFPTRVDALAHFQRVCLLAGWDNDVVEVLIRTSLAS